MAGTMGAGTDAVEGRLGSASDLEMEVIDHEASSFLARDLNVLSGRMAIGRRPIMAVLVVEVMVEEVRRRRSRIGTGRCPVAPQVQSNPRSDDRRLVLARETSGQLFPVVDDIG